MATDATPCATIIGARAKDGGQPCGHLPDEHEQHEDGAFVYYVCRPCRKAGVKWTTEFEYGVTGADHRPSTPRTVPANRAVEIQAE